MRLASILVVLALLPTDLPAVLIAEDEKPFLLQFTNEAANTAGFGPLKRSRAAEGSSEIRVWIGFGIVVPEHMLRLRINRAGEVTGEVLVYFPSDISYMEERAEAFRNEVMRSCTNMRGGAEKDVCTATFKREPDWRALHKKLIKLGIADLPDESELPEPEFVVNDGIAMVVEIRDGSSYRAYEYSNPMFRSEPEAEAATRILDTVNDVFGESHDPEHL